MSVSLLDQVTKLLLDTVTAGDPLSLALAVWLRVADRTPLLSTSQSSLWTPREVAIAALLEAAGKESCRTFAEGLAALRGREFFAPHSPNVFESDPMAIFSVAVGIRRLADAAASEWITNIADRAAVGESDPWRLGLLAAVPILFDAKRDVALPPELGTALSAMGIHAIDELTRKRALDVCLVLDNPSAERAAIRLASLREIVATSIMKTDVLSDSSPRHTVPKPVKVLFLSANPNGTTRLAIEEELRGIQEALRKAEHRDAFDMVFVPAVRHDDLEQALLEHKPVIVHFSGHGSSSDGLVFQGDCLTDARLVSADALGHLFSLLKKNVRLVVLNACYSQEQAMAIVKEIDFVIGMNDLIGDQAARKFAVSFYRGLGFGETMEVAFGLGINALKREGLTVDASVPVLLVRPGASRNAVLVTAS